MPSPVLPAAVRREDGCLTAGAILLAIIISLTLGSCCGQTIDPRGDPKPMSHREPLAQALRARIETLKAIRDPDEETLRDLAIIEELLERLEERQRLEEREPAWARATGQTLH
jgi:hypothetical protein